MDRLLYIAMNGAKQLLQSQSVVSNNLANANTAGFRADMQAYESVGVQGPTYPSRIYANAVGVGVDLTPGPVASTGRDMDVTVRGEGYIAIRAPDGSEAYTRAGDLQVTETGQLVTGSGHPVLGNGGPIALPPFEKIVIGNDGTITIRPVGQSASTLTVANRIKLVTIPDADVSKGVDGLLRNSRQVETPADANVKVESGYLEGSNVSTVESLVEMISLSRQYEMQVKMMQTANETAKAGEGLMRLG